MVEGVIQVILVVNVKEDMTVEIVNYRIYKVSVTVRHCTDAMGLNPTQAPIFFFLRWGRERGVGKGGGGGGSGLNLQ